jgi:hypothetical protein
MSSFAESTIEETTLKSLKNMGYTIVFGNDIARSVSAPRLMRGGAHVKDVEREIG